MPKLEKPTCFGGFEGKGEGAGGERVRLAMVWSASGVEAVVTRAEGEMQE